MKPFRFHVTTTLCVAILVASIDASSAAPFTFEEPFNFRDHRDNTLIDGGISDLLQFGNDAVNGNVFVPGIKVTGTNSQSNETFRLEECGGSDVCYFSLVPYTAARAAGSWQIQGMSGVNSGQISVPAFGTGPGTNALPFAQNVQIIGNNSTPTITWTLPPGVSGGTVNDGNVDRWRIRVNNGNASADFGDTLFDSRSAVGNLPLTTTAFQIPGGVITGTGKFRVQVMLEGTSPFNRSRVRADLVLQNALSDPYASRDRFDNRLIGVGGGIDDFLQVGVDLVDSNDAFIPGATVTVTNPGASETFELAECGAPFKCYFAFVPYTSALANGVWQVQATFGQTLVGVLPSFGTGFGTEPLPFAQNVQVSGNEFTPTFSWTLPPELVNHLIGSQLLNDGNVNRWRVRVNRVNSDGTTGDQIFDSRRSRRQDPKRGLPLTTTSFQVPAGFITGPGRYRVAIMLEGLRPFNRSRARIDFGTDPSVILVPITTILLDDD